MNISNLSESKYLKKEDVDPSIVVTITGLSKENLAQEGEHPEYKYILKFKECKPMVLNPTNGQLIAMALGSDETDNWMGKQITLWNDKSVSYAGKITGGIRVKPDAPNAPVPAGEPAPTQPIDEMNDDIPF